MIDANLKLRKSNFVLEARFSVPGSGVTGVFGPSGSGKTSLLRVLAGLEAEASGTLSVNDAIWLDGKGGITTLARKVGFVFQVSALFPHLSILDNLLYGRKRIRNSSYLLDIDKISEILRLQPLLDRNPGSLSGGERQRVAIGRALLASPSLLLMDEPLSAVDQQARNQLIQILENIFQEIEIPVLYVSHSSGEIARLAENLILMENGQVTAAGELRNVLGEVDAPFNESDEAFSVLRCRIHANDLQHLTTITNEGGLELYVPRQGASIGTAIRLRIRARDVSLCLRKPEDSSILNILPATVVALAKCTERGSRTVKLDMAGDNLLARVSEYSVQKLQLLPGMVVYAQIKSMSLISK